MGPEGSFVGQSKLTASPPSNRGSFLFLSLICLLGGWEGGLWLLGPYFRAPLPQLWPKWRKRSKGTVGAVLGLGPSWQILSARPWKGLHSSSSD